MTSFNSHNDLTCEHYSLLTQNWQ